MISIVSESERHQETSRGIAISRTSSFSTPGKLRMCHMCGDAFPKSSLPSHQRGCIRKSLSTPNAPIVTSRISFSAGGDASIHDYSKYSRKAPLLKFAAHFKNDSPNDQKYRDQESQKTLESLNNIPRVPSLSRKANSAQNMYSPDFEDVLVESDISTASFAKRSVLNPIPSSVKDNVTYKDQIREFSTRPPSRSSIVSLSAKKKQPFIPNTGPGVLVSGSFSTTSSTSVSRSSTTISPAKAQSHEYMREASPVDSTYERIESSRNSSSNTVQNHRQMNQPVVAPPIKKVPHPTFHEDENNEQLDVSDYLIPCSICNRKFMENRLEKHRQVCLKTNQKQRKPFDVQAARVQGTEMEKYVLRKAVSDEAPKTKKSNWRAKHEAFRHMVVSARQPVTRNSSGSINLPAQPAFDPNPDYITCPCCERRFNEDSGKRHIPICKEKAAKKALERPSVSRGRNSLSAHLSSNGNGMPVKDKMEELKRRTAYKPPTPRSSKARK